MHYELETVMDYLIWFKFTFYGALYKLFMHSLTVFKSYTFLLQDNFPERFVCATPQRSELPTLISMLPYMIISHHNTGSFIHVVTRSLFSLFYLLAHFIKTAAYFILLRLIRWSVESSGFLFLWPYLNRTAATVSFSRCPCGPSYLLHSGDILESFRILLLEYHLAKSVSPYLCLP